VSAYLRDLGLSGAKPAEPKEKGHVRREPQTGGPDLETLTRRYERRFTSRRARKEAERELAEAA
jgi:hypothetical protein